MPVGYFEYIDALENGDPVPVVPSVSVGRYQIGIEGLQVSKPIEELDALIGLSLIRMDNEFIIDSDTALPELSDTEVYFYERDPDSPVTATLEYSEDDSIEEFTALKSTRGTTVLEVLMEEDNPPSSWLPGDIEGYAEGSVIIYKNTLNSGVASDGIYVLMLNYIDDETPASRHFVKLGTPFIVEE